jgi:hypothetical protein
MLTVFSSAAAVAQKARAIARDPNNFFIDFAPSSDFS